MAQHNLSCSLSRSLNVYLRCQCYRHGALPRTIRGFHNRIGGTGSDDTIKQRQNDKIKVKDSSALRVHRCGKPKVSPTVDKSLSPVGLHDVSAEVKQGQIQKETLVKCQISADKPGAPQSRPKDGSKLVKGFEKLDMARFEKTCEENNKYIQDLLKSTEPNAVKPEPKAQKPEPKVMAKQDLKIPSHEEVYRARLKQESTVKNVNPYVVFKETIASEKLQGFSIPPRKNPEKRLQSHEVKSMEDTMTSFNAQHLNSSIHQTESKVLASHKRDLPKTSNLEVPIAIKVSQAQSPAPARGTKLVRESMKGKSFDKVSDLDVSVDYYKNPDLGKAKKTKRSGYKPTITLGADTVEPYVFPVATEKLDTKSHNPTKINSTKMQRKKKDKKASAVRKEKVPFEFRDYYKSETPERKYSTGNKDTTDNNNVGKDQKVEQEVGSSGFVDSSPLEMNKLNEVKAGLPENSVVGNIESRAPLRGTVALLLEINSRQEANFLGENRAPLTLSYGDSKDFTNTTSINSNVMGRSENIEFEDDGKFESDSKPTNKSKCPKTMRSKSADNTPQSVDIEILEEEFEKTIGSQIMSEYAKKESVSSSPSEIKNTPISNPTDNILEVKSVEPVNYKMCTKSLKSGCNVVKNAIRAQSNLTPGDLYQSNSECNSFEQRLDEKSEAVKRLHFEKRNKRVAKLSQRPQMKSEQKVTKQKNIEPKMDLEPRKNRKAKFDRTLMLDETQTLKTKASKQKNIGPKKRIESSSNFKEGKSAKSKKSEMGFSDNSTDKRMSKNAEYNSKEKLKKSMNNEQNSQNDHKTIKSETQLTPGELYNSKSEGHYYDARENTYYKPKKVWKTKMNFKPKKIKLSKKTDSNEEKEEPISLNPQKYRYKTKDNEKIESEATHVVNKRINVKKRSNKEMKMEHDSKKIQETGKIEELKSDYELPQIGNTREAIKARNRDDTLEENLKNAKRYISKAKRLHDIAKKKSLERKNRRRSGVSKKSKKKKAKKSNEKMSLSDFLYGLVSGKKGGGNQRNFTTYTAARSISISHNWPLKRRKVHRYNIETKSFLHTKKGDVFISPDVFKQGLGADNVKKERKRNEERRKKKKSKEATKNFSLPFDINQNTPKIGGGSLMEQKYNKRFNKIKIEDEQFDIQILGGPHEVKSQHPSNTNEGGTTKQSFNTLSQNIWQSIRYFFPVTHKVPGKQN